MRRLPIFFLLDCSESMVGDNFDKLQDALNNLTSTLKKDPNALENVYISVIAFAGIAKTIVNLVELPSFYLPKLPLGSGTSLGASLTELMFQIDKNVIKTTNDVKGDWKPLVFLITDGKPTDECESAVQKWNTHYKNKAKIIAVAVGKYADTKVLNKISEDVLFMANTQSDDMHKFVSWITASIITQSKSVAFNSQEDNLLDNIDKSILKKVDSVSISSNKIDIDCAVLVGKCQHTKKPYLMKYDCNESDLKYDLAGCYPIDSEYFNWSDTRKLDAKINTNELMGVPGCPYCGAISAFALCTCGKLLCTNGMGENICPWCETKLIFNHANGGEEGFNVSRGRG